MKDKQEAIDKIDSALKDFDDKVNSVVDEDRLKSLVESLSNLKEKSDRKEHLSLKDLKETLSISRNLIIPIAMVKEINKLKALREMILAISERK